MKTRTENNNPAKQQKIYDVIISGAGPVGLFLACELALKKCSVLILEQAGDPQSPLKQLPFGIRGLSAPSTDALYRRGLLQQVKLALQNKPSFQAPAQLKGQRLGGHFAGIPIAYDRIDTSQWPYRLPGSADTNMLTVMEDIESVLSDRAESLGVEIRRGLALTDFHQNTERVSVQCDALHFESKWLLGCDGGRSIVRKKGGFQFSGTDPEFTGYSFHAALADPEKLSMGRVYTPAGMYTQSQPGIFAMIDYDKGAFHRTENITPEHVQSVLRRISDTDVTITALYLVSTWTDRAQLATAYRNNRVLLAGDAAHIHSPLGGQGLNLGLGDAMNLGWKLAAAIKGTAAEGLLDTYFSERHPLAEQILDWSRAQVAIMKPDPAARALNAMIRDLIDTGDGATYFAGRIWGVTAKYELGMEHDLAGRSVPDYELEHDLKPDDIVKPEKGTRLGEMMQDGMGILLDFKNNESLRALAARYGGQIKYLQANAKKQLNATAMLIRPDGVVAWACSRDVDYRELQAAIEKCFRAPD